MNKGKMQPMILHKRSKALLILASSVWLLGSGCATSRGILPIEVATQSNPDTGQTFRIVEVKDSRVFELRPPQPSTPSLENGEIQDESITLRAIARKRNGYGKALGDILLPEGRTVLDLTRESITRAMRESGLRVLSEADPGWKAATPLQADIQQLWAWMTPGFWSLALDFDMRVRITTDLGFFREGQEAHGAIRLHSQAAGTRAWRNTITKGLEEFNRDLKQKLTQAVQQIAP